MAITYIHCYAEQGETTVHKCPKCGHKIYCKYPKIKVYYPVLSGLCRWCKQYALVTHYVKHND
jgi:hypothetical protein